jgi:predicted enzyme related to lactoylglutathione lyase
MAKRKTSACATICHIEIPAPDLEKAKAFYKQIFGWKVEDSPLGRYCMFTAGDLGGGFDPDLPVADAGVRLVLKVKDIPATMREIVAAGGRAIRGKQEIGGGFGFWALFRDPNGNQLAIWSKT